MWRNSLQRAEENKFGKLMARRVSRWEPFFSPVYHRRWMHALQLCHLLRKAQVTTEPSCLLAFQTRGALLSSDMLHHSFASAERTPHFIKTHF
jgi:hypothetical protein